MHEIRWSASRCPSLPERRKRSPRRRPEGPLKKLDYLESLRGLAALVVVFAHYVLAFYPALYWAKPDQVHTEQALELLLSGTPVNLLYNGDFSVSIFFVLSYKFFQDRSAPLPLAPLVVKRYVRLLVPVLFSLPSPMFCCRHRCSSTSPRASSPGRPGWPGPGSSRRGLAARSPAPCSFSSPAP